MKKCLIVSTVSRQFTLFERGNIEVLKELGYEIHCAANFSDATKALDELPIIRHNIDIQRSPFSLKNLKAYGQLKQIIKNEKFDLIHCHSPMGGALARLASRKTRKENMTRVIYTAHGFHFYKGAPVINWLLYYPVEKYLSKFTDCIITINDEDYNLAKRKFKTKEIKLVNGIGVDQKKFNFEMNKEQRNDMRRKLNLKEDDFIILTVGELNDNKNQAMAIKAIKRVTVKNNKIKLLIAGTGNNDNKYKEMIKKYKIENNVFLIGYRNDINKVIKISDILISTSKREGLPVNIIEAIIAGLPVIATNCRGNRDLIKNDENGYLIEINNLEQLKEKILKISNKKFKIQNGDLNLSRFYKINVQKEMKKIYMNMTTKKVYFLRSTSIKNDSRVIKEATSLAKNGYNVNILGWNRDGFLKKDKEIIVNENIKIQIQLFEKRAEYAEGMKSIFKLLAFQFWLIKKLKNNINKFDAIHACDFDTAIPAKIISKIYKKKFIYDIFDYYIDSHYVPNILKKTIGKMENNIINCADCVIICNKERKRQIAKAHPRNCIVIYNTPEIKEEELNKSIIKSKNNKIKITYVGILQENRLLREIGLIISKNQGFELHIGGFGNLEDFFIQLSKKYDNIYFYGKMEYKNVLRLENESDILFATYNPDIPNHKYSAPNKLYEAMALGKPIIVCRNTGIDKIVMENNMGIIIDYNETEFLNAIKFIQNSNEYGKESKKIYDEKYSWKKMENRLIEIYK